MKTRSTAASFPILTVKWPITSLFLDANFEYYELSSANKTKPKMGRLSIPLALKQKRNESTNTAKVRKYICFELFELVYLGI